MSNYRLNDEYGPGEWSAAKLMGILLTMFGVGVILWTVIEIFQLFSHGSAFIVLNEIVPAQIEIVKNGLLLPRELLVYGLPIWAFSVTTKIGIMLLKNGLEYVERPRKTGK